ncbi:MAG: ATP-binding cassette domain-containing protein [Rubrivivax sp.]|nr:ATP-binding cassette domain-containing protein [Rubrivivax sp.]
MIRVVDLHKRFASGRGRQRRSVAAVAGVDFTAADGAITALLGPNGAGKTTTLRIAAGLMPPDSGGVVVDGIDVARSPRAALARLGVLSDARGLYPRLTARENIVYHGRLHGMGAEAANERAAALARLLEMVPLLDRRTDGFSQGERMKTALARALVHDPPNIVLDEPTNGLDVLSTRALREALAQLRHAGTGGVAAGRRKCIVFSTHIMQEVQRLADRVVLVSHGRVVAEGSAADLCAQAGVDDFEEAFVRLAFSAAERAQGSEGAVR